MATMDSPPLQAPVSGCAVCAGVVPQPSAGTVKSLRARLTAALGVRWSASPAPVALCQRCLRRLRDVEQLGARHCRLTAALTQLYSRAADAKDDTTNACIACRSAIAADDSASAFWDKTQFTSTTLADMLSKLMPERPEPGRPAGAGVCDPCVSRLNRLDGLFARFHQQARVLIHGLRATAVTEGGDDRAVSGVRPAGASECGAADDPRANPLPLLDEVLLRLSPRRDETDSADLPPPLDGGSTEQMPLLEDGGGDGEDVDDDRLAIENDAGDVGLLGGAGDVEEDPLGDNDVKGSPLGDGDVGYAAVAEEAEADEDKYDDQDEDDPPAVEAMHSAPSSPAAARTAEGRPVGPPLRTIYVQLVAGGDIARVPSRSNKPPAAAVRRRITAGRAPTKVEETVQVVRLGPSDKLVPRVLPYRKRPPPDPTSTNANSSGGDAANSTAADGATTAGDVDADDPTGGGDGPTGGKGETRLESESEPPLKRKRGRPRKTDVRGPGCRILHRKLQYVTSKALTDQKAESTDPPTADLSQSDPPAGPGGDGPADGTSVLDVVKPADPEWLPMPKAGSDQVQEEHRHRLAEAMKRINERLLLDKRKQTSSRRKLEDTKAEGGDDVEMNVEDRDDIDEPDDGEDLEDGEDTYSPEDGEEDIDDPEDGEDEEASGDEEDGKAVKEGEDTEEAEEGENIELSGRSRRVNGLYVCEVCQKSFALLRELLKHERSHTEAKFPCPMCNKSFTLPKLVRKHQKFHKTPTAYECELCGHRCRSQVVLLDHLHAHTGGEHLTCGVCGRSFATMSSYRSHQRQHAPGGRQPQCDDCGRVMQSRAALQRHRAHSHTLPKYLPCPHAGCERRFDAEKTLAHHLLQHVSGPPWRCTLCDKEFRTKYTLRDHVRTHSGQKPHACELCGMRFSQRSNLTMHVRYVHQNDRRFACTLCGKRYKRRSLLHYHMLCHEGDRPLQCPRCPMRMVYPQHLKKHLQTHSGEKPHSCGVCHKSFSRRDNLRAHMFTHSNKKQFECRQCGTGFVRKMSLLQHMEHFGHGAHPDDYVINRTLLTTEPAPAAEEVHTLELMDTPDGQLVVLVTDGVGESGVTPGALRSGRHIDLILHQSAKILTQSATGGEGGGDDDGDGEELVLEDSAAVDLILQSAVQTADGQLILQGDGSGGGRILQLGAEEGQTLFLQGPEDGTGVAGTAGEQQWILQEVPDETGLAAATDFTDAPVLQAPPT